MQQVPGTQGNSAAPSIPLSKALTTEIIAFPSSRATLLPSHWPGKSKSSMLKWEPGFHWLPFMQVISMLQVRKRKTHTLFPSMGDSAPPWPTQATAISIDYDDVLAEKRGGAEPWNSPDNDSHVIEAVSPMRQQSAGLLQTLIRWVEAA